MKIAFDAKRAFNNRSGLGNYSRNLISSALRFHPENTYFLFSPISSSEIFDPSGAHTVTNSGVFSWFWRSFGITGILIKDNIDVYHGLSNELPLNIKRFNGKKIVTIHDVLFKRYPSYYPAIDRYIYNLKTKQACKDADTIICISSQTKDDLIQFYNADPSKLVVVHQPVCEEYFEHTDDPEKEEAYELQKKYILYVGTIEDRKDLITLLKAFRDLSDPDILLYVVGGKREKYFRKVLSYIVDHDLYERVIFFEKVPGDVLPLIYRKAFMVVYPSVMEGWGLPVAEAIVSHAAVISTRNTSMEEAGGDACLYFDAGNDRELLELMETLLNSEVDRQRLINKTFSRARKFELKTYSDKINEIYLK